MSLSKHFLVDSIHISDGAACKVTHFGKIQAHLTAKCVLAEAPELGKPSLGKANVSEGKANETKATKCEERRRCGTEDVMKNKQIWMI